MKSRGAIAIHPPTPMYRYMCLDTYVYGLVIIGIATSFFLLSWLCAPHHSLRDLAIFHLEFSVQSDTISILHELYPERGSVWFFFPGILKIGS